MFYDVNETFNDITIMSSYVIKTDIEIDVLRLDSDIIDEHLRSSTAVLQDILNNDNNQGYGSDFAHTCRQCGKLYKTANSLNMHCLLKHPGNNLEVTCVDCNKKYPSLMSLQKHIRYMHRYKNRCKACYRTFETAEQLSDHAECCGKIETPCTECGKIFDSKIALRNHNKYKHPRSTNNLCELCRRTFTSSRSLSNHMASIHSPSATCCDSCQRSFNSIPALQSHLLKKHSTDGLLCKLCCKVFRSNNSLYRHLRKIHSTDKNKCHCNKCKVNCKSSIDLSEHLLTTPSYENSLDSNSE